MADERENIRPPEKSLTPGPKPDTPVSAPTPPKKDVPIGFGVVTPEMERYRAMLAKDPGSRVFAALSELYRKAGMLDEAVRLCLNGTKAHPKYMSGRVALARAYFDKGMIKEAKEEVLTVVSITPDNILANKILGEIQLLEGDAAKAVESFTKVLSLSPDDAEAKEKLLEAQRGPKAPPRAPDKAEDILEAETLEEMPEGEPSDIIEDIIPLEEGEDLVSEPESAPAPDKEIPVGGDDLEIEGADLDIPLEDDGSLDDLFAEETAGDVSMDEFASEPGADAGGPPETGEVPLESGQEEGEHFETSVGYVPDDDYETRSDQQGADEDIDMDEEQELVDEFGILEEAGGDITIEGLDDGERPVVGKRKVPSEETPTVRADEGGTGRQERPAQVATVQREGATDAQGVTITTETIADIYVKQGYYDKALSVYEELLGAYPTRDSLKQKIAFVRNKMRGAAEDSRDQEAISIGGGQEPAGPGMLEADESGGLEKNIESLNRWLLAIRKLRRH